MREYSPVVLFVYNRLEHTKKTVEALKKNVIANETEVFIFSDAAKVEKNIQQVEEVRKYIGAITGFKSVTIYKARKNLGLAQSIITGVTQIINKYGTVIVLEDDIVTSPFFLSFMNDALSLYREEKQVFTVTGYSHLENAKVLFNHNQVYFTSMVSTWGWATWYDRWKKFDLEATGWENLKNNKKLAYKYNIEGSIDRTSMLIRQMEEDIDSWGTRWAWTVFMNGGVNLEPYISLIQNIGMDGSGVHYDSKNIVEEKKTSLLEYKIDNFEIATKESRLVRLVIASVHRKKKIMHYLHSGWFKAKSLLLRNSK